MVYMPSIELRGSGVEQLWGESLQSGLAGASVKTAQALRRFLGGPTPRLILASLTWANPPKGTAAEVAV